MKPALISAKPSLDLRAAPGGKTSLVTLLLVAGCCSAAALPPSTLAAEGAKEAVDTYTTRIFITDSDGANMRPMANLPEVKAQGSPKWSRDGKLIAFDGKTQAGAGLSGSQIYVVNADGTNMRHLIDGYMPSLSPESNRIVCSRSSGGGGIWVVSTEGQEKELVQIDERGWGAHWAADGRIVYATHARGGANLVVFDLVEGRRDFLFDEQNSPYSQIAWNFVWSPDSKRIVFKGTTKAGIEEVAIVDARGEKFGLVHRFAGTVLPSFAWSPEKSRILICKVCPEREKLTQLYFLDPDTQAAPELLAAQPADRGNLDMCYSPDGKKIAISTRMPAPAKPLVKEKTQSAK